MVKLWKAQHALAYVDLASNITIPGSDSLVSAFGSSDDIKTYLKNVTITPPKSEIKKVDLLGVDSNGYQNMELDESPYDLAKISGTMIVDEVSRLEKYVSGSYSEINSAYTRFKYGVVHEYTSSSGRPLVSMFVGMRTPVSGTATKMHEFLLDSGYMNFGDYKLSDASSYWEVDFELTCKPSDFYHETMETGL